MKNDMKKVLILATGGTIVSRATDYGLVPADIHSFLYDKLKVLADNVEVDIQTVFLKDSSNIVPSDWDMVAETISKNIDMFDGIVILHGTDTMSYSAAMLSYLFIGVGKPIVFTGAQLPIEVEGSDGVVNLKDAVIVATDERLKGVFVVFNGKIMNGTRSYKRSSIDMDAYISCNYPYAGKVNDLKVKLAEDYLKLCQREAGQTAIELMKWNRFKEPARIFFLKMVPGMDSCIINYLEENEYHGIVIEGFGLGELPMADEELKLRLKRLTKKGIPVVMATQCVYDGVNLDTYEVGVQAKQLGILSAWDMTSEGVYTKLMWILTLTRDYAQIKMALETNFCGEIMFVAEFGANIG